ncbi:hypothetical protein Fmac_017045 [Flemingia macrophylla]|uniref:Uncharacterized protein n=1 Tax=Flemingia macrophylla TaxID=520843 RepID=A0ABD1M104_9FABA
MGSVYIWIVLVTLILRYIGYERQLSDLNANRLEKRDTLKGEAGGNEALDGSLEVHGVAVAVVGVADDGDGDGLGDESTLVEHFAVGDESGVGKSQPGGGDGEAAGDAEGEAGRLNELGAQRVETRRSLVNPRPLHQPPKHLHFLPRRHLTLLATRNKQFLHT